MDPETAFELLPLRDAVVANFDANNWLELGVVTSSPDIVRDHPRLLRSLSWGDPDYGAAALEVILSLMERDASYFDRIKRYVASKFATPLDVNASAGSPSEARIYFKPNVFSIPETPPLQGFVAVMMPFSAEFDGVYNTIREAAADCGIACHRVDNVWDNSVVVQDIFSLIYNSSVVICDFTGKNPNVFYEAGIAHTLGRDLVPIT